MITVNLFDPVTGTCERGGIDLMQRWEASNNHIIWVDSHGEDEAADRILFSRFGIHPLVTDDAMRARHPPKIESFSNHLFMLFRGLDKDTTGIDFGVIQLSLVAGERFLLTRHTRSSISCAWALDQLRADPALLEGGTSLLCTIICGRLVRRYVEILLELEQRLEDIEREIFESPRDEQLAELTQYKARLREVQRIANYHVQVVNGMRINLDAIAGGSHTHELTDVYEQVERTLSLAGFYYDYAKDLTDGYLALSAHRLNSVMQVLTVITVIFVPLTFIAGIYGMNFEYMPELQFGPAYFIVLAFMLIVGVSLVILFRRRGWV